MDELEGKERPEVGLEEERTVPDFCLFTARLAVRLTRKDGRRKV